MTSLPRIRSGLLRHALDKQVLVYDSRDDRVHLLDPTTACVLELLEEGGWTPEGITRELSDRLGVTTDPGLLVLALDQLREADLLDQSVHAAASLSSVNRRDVVRKLAMTGAASLLVPTIATLTATPGYAQGSQLADGAACGSNPGRCASGRCCSGFCGNTTCFGNGINFPCTSGQPAITCCSCTCHALQNFCVASD